MYRASTEGFLVGAALAFILIALLLSGSVLHAMVPHEHGHSAVGFAMWGDMHAALTNQYKILALAFSGLVIVSGLLVQVRSHARIILTTVSTDVPALNRLLKRGIPAYRVFG